jgi:hypothetical protein
MFACKKILEVLIIIYRFGSLLGCPTIALCTLSQKSFGLSMYYLFMEYLFAECWSSPAITMILNTITPENKGFGKINILINL